VIKPAYFVSSLLSINIFVWQNVLYFPNGLRTSMILILASPQFFARSPLSLPPSHFT